MPSVDPTHVPTLFKWSQTWGNHICIAGSFDPPIPTWTPIEMKKNKDHVHEVVLDLLPDKKYYFKFVIDGNWVLDEGYPSCPDSSGNWNHEIQVELPPPPPPPAEEEKEEVVVDEQVQQEVAFEEEKHQEMTDEHQIEQQQEVQVINEDHQEEHHHDHQAIAEDHKIEEQQHQEEQIIDEVKEEQNQYQEVHNVDETEQQHQEEQVQHQPQLDHQIVAEDHHVDENKHHQEEQVVNEDKEEHHQHQEDHQVVEELHQHHHEENQTVTEINTTEQSLDVPVITGAIETETIINETMVEQPELSSTVKETIIESDNDQLSAEHVANNIDDVIIEDTESISPVIIDENVEKVTPEVLETEGQNIEQSEDSINEFKVTEETSSAGEKQETVVSSTTETEIPIESSSFSTDEINEGEIYEPEHKTINENEDENEEDYDYSYENEGAEGSEDTIAVEENLPEEVLKEVLLNNTWAKDDTLEETIPSSWTEETYESQSVIWPDNTNLKWSDINKEETAETEIETTNKPETEVEDYSEHVLKETRVTEITSNDESNVNEEVLSRETPSTEETITEQVVEEISAQPVVESHIEHKTKESDYETGINNQVPTSEVKERMPSFAQFEKPESSATADKIPVLSSIPTTVVAAPAEEIIPPKAIDTSKVDDVLKDNISPTNTSPIKETVNIKHMKPVVEITSREILQKDSKIVIQHDEEEEKIDLNEMAYLATSVATTFTLGIISMLYKSVFRAKNQ